ncbi:hypothetical protein DFH06DRAFT_1152571 [Mycena polygramma]|nr:hypothetical protein DFH06DRAFT_1152571 [Mycena polygramma]
MDILTLEICAALVQPDSQDFGDHPRFTDEFMQAHLLDAYKSDVAFKGFLHMNEVPADMVMCQARIVTSKTVDGDNLHTLCIRFTTPGNSGLQPAMLNSPVAIVDNYFGNVEDLAAPNWISLKARSDIRFRLRREHAAELFAALAMAAYNLVQPQLSQRMIDWAVYAAVGTSAAGNIHCPQTPKKHRPLKLDIPGRPQKASEGRRYLFSVVVPGPRRPCKVQLPMS